MKEYRRHKCEITKLGEEQYRLQVWLPSEDTRSPWTFVRVTAN